jgi:hypothetical protein
LDFVNDIAYSYIQNYHYTHTYKKRIFSYLDVFLFINDFVHVFGLKEAYNGRKLVMRVMIIMHKKCKGFKSAV